MTDHAPTLRVAAPFLTNALIKHLAHRIGGAAASGSVQSKALCILFGLSGLMDSLLILGFPDPQGWSASRELFFLLAGMLFLAFVPLVAAGVAWMIIQRIVTEEPYERQTSGAMELLLICYIGSAIGLAPRVLPPTIAIFLAASASETQVLLPIGMMFLLPSLVAYSVCIYWILFHSGKSTGERINVASRHLQPQGQGSLDLLVQNGRKHGHWAGPNFPKLWELIPKC